jgi:hypothetical protein
MFNASSDNCFELVDSDNMYKILAIALSAGSGLLVAPGIYGVIWFEHFGDRFNKTPFWA